MNIEPYRDEIPPQREILPNGASFLSLHIEQAHSVALGVWLCLGAEHEAPQLNGLTHFIEHIVFKGSQNRSAFEIASAFDRLGASVDAFTTKDHVAFTLKVLPEYLAPACDVLVDMIMRPSFDPEMVELERQVICEEIQEAFDGPEDRLHDAFAAEIYGEHPRGRPILGTAASVRGLSADILRSEHARLFRGSNLVIALTGNMLAGAREIVLKRFRELPADGAVADAGPDVRAPAASVTVDPRAGSGGNRLEIRSPITQSYFEIGNLAVSYRHADRIPLYVLSNILGGGLSSRIFQAVREREGLAYTVYNYSDMGRDIGLVSCAGSCSPGKTLRVEQLVRQEYGRLIQDGVDRNELESNRAQIKSRIVFLLEGVMNQMYRIAKNEIYFGRFVPVTELVDKIDSVDGDAIVRCARDYFDPERIFVATHGPK